MSLPDLNRDKPIATTSGFGRVFFGGGSTIYYSPVIEHIGDLGRCYQTADPTSDEISDPLATDGGRILLKNAGEILDLVTYNSGVLAFTNKGVWYIYNNETGFTNTSFAIQKITDEVIADKGSVVEANGVLYYGTATSLNVITPNENNYLVSQSISDGVIRDYWIDNFDEGFKAVFDSKEKNIWFVSNKNEPTKDLCYNVVVQAFYPQDFNTTGAYEVLEPLYFNGDRGLVFSVLNAVDFPETINYNFADLSGTDFKDIDTDINAYLLSGYETLGKFSHKKGITTASFFFKKTEENITGFDNESFTYLFDKPSACRLQVRWDFDNSNVFHRWVGDTTSVNTNSKSINLYNPMVRGIVPSEDAFPVAFDTGEQVIRKRTKLRGRGDAVQFYFEAQPEKDMQLLGYSVEYKMKGRQG